VCHDSWTGPWWLGPFFSCTTRNFMRGSMRGLHAQMPLLKAAARGIVKQHSMPSQPRYSTRRRHRPASVSSSVSSQSSRAPPSSTNPTAASSMFARSSFARSQSTPSLASSRSNAIHTGRSEETRAILSTMSVPCLLLAVRSGRHRATLPPVVIRFTSPYITSFGLVLTRVFCTPGIQDLSITLDTPLCDGPSSRQG